MLFRTEEPSPRRAAGFCRFATTIRRCALALLCCLLIQRNAVAGGGPENVLLVVNADSWSSLTIANHYAEWRQIPSVNILFVRWRFSDQPLSAAEFRRALLGPIVQEMQRRGIEEQIDYIVYSSDFPTEIDITEDLANANLPEQVVRTGSLTGLTYLWNQSLFGDPRYIIPTANTYAREQPDSAAVAPPHGFRQWYGWGTKGELREAGGNHYLLSSMLAVTHGGGNSTREALKSLFAAARSDGTRPAGTMYFVQNSDVRSRARDDRYTAAVRALRQYGVQSSVLRGALPRDKPDVQGVVMGIRQFDWPAAGNTILPGALCDNLTDLGGSLRTDTNQTSFAEFIRYGAAGASGPVATPYQIVAQFPSPLVQAHYASGCTLAEAFYQSIPCPFQTLLVGDPLCRPWARIPVVELDGVTTGATVKGTLEITPRVRGGTQGATPDRFHFFVDGRRWGVARTGDSFALDTTVLADGYHELRVVAIENGPIETQGRAVVGIQTDNHGKSITLTTTPNGRVRWGEKLTLTASAPGATSIRIQRCDALLTEISGAEGTVELDPKTLGYGPVRLDAIVMSDNPADQIRSAPLTVQVAPEAPRPALSMDAGALPEGLLFAAEGQDPVVIPDAATPDWLAQLGIGPRQTVRLSGVYDAPQADIYQFHVRFAGELAIKVDGQMVDQFTSEQANPRIVPVVLAAGPHRIELEGTTGPQPVMEAKFGFRGVAPMAAPAFRYEP